MRMSIRIVVFFSLILFSGLALPVQANDALVADLGAEDFEIRRSATDALLLDDSLTVEQLAGWYASADDPEVRQRLRVVARHHFLQKMRLERFPGEGPGSIGVVQSMQISLPDLNADDQAPGAGRPTTFALVTRVLDGFPASGRLRPLDRVVALDGQALGGGANNQRFEDLMRRYRSGQTLTLTVLRNGDSLDIAIPLANGNGLGAMYAFPEFGLTADFDQAWNQHQQTHFPPAEGNLAPASTPDP